MNEHFVNTDPRKLGWTLAAVGMLLVSTDSLFVRLSEAEAFDIAFLVSIFSLPLLLILQRVSDEHGFVETFRRHPRPLVAVSVLAAASQVAFIAALTRTAVSNVVVIVAATPIIAALIAWIALGERTAPRVWVAIGITIVGILVVVSGSLGEPTLDGDLLAVAAIAAFATNMTIWRRYPDMSRYVGLLLAAGLTLLVTVFLASPLTLELRAYLATAAMGLGFNPLGRVAFTHAPRYAPAAEVALFSPIETVAATIWALIFFQEVPEAATVAGGLIVILGVLYGTFGRGREFNHRRARVLRSNIGRAGYSQRPPGGGNA